MGKVFKFCNKCKKTYSYEISGNMKKCPVCDADLERDEFESEEECLDFFCTKISQSQLYLYGKINDTEMIIDIPDDYTSIRIGRAYQEGWPLNVSRHHVTVSKSKEYDDAIIVELCDATNGTKLLGTYVEYMPGNKNILKLNDIGGAGRITLDAVDGHGIDLIIKKREGEKI